MLRKLTYTMSNLRLDEFCWQNDEKADYFHFAMSKVAYGAKTRPGDIYDVWSSNWFSNMLVCNNADK